MSSELSVVFVHGLWLHASSWEPWIAHFAQAGYQAAAPGWPGEPASVESARNDPDSNAVSEEESQALYDRCVAPSPGRPLFEAAAANFSLPSPAKVNTKTPSAARCFS